MCQTKTQENCQGPHWQANGTDRQCLSHTKSLFALRSRERWTAGNNRSDSKPIEIRKIRNNWPTEGNSCENGMRISVIEENPEEAFVHVQTNHGSVASPHGQASGLLCESSTSQEVLRTIAGEPAARISSAFMGLGLRGTKGELG
ncbi:hypothetical protein EK904_010011 [Melospiza melodia maxima]|nr:hypothetical protein EK904_010011 [Melospiza melodia maxima]